MAILCIYIYSKKIWFKNIRWIWDINSVTPKHLEMYNNLLQVKADFLDC